MVKVNMGGRKTYWALEKSTLLEKENNVSRYEIREEKEVIMKAEFIEMI